MGGTVCCSQPPVQKEMVKRDNLMYNSGVITDFYDFSEKLGQGSFGCVVKGTVKKADGEQKLRAIKMISNECDHIDLMFMEIDILADLSHPNVIKLYEAFQDTAMTYLVMELCAGGNLFEAIVAANAFTESQAANVMRQALRSIRYMHQKHVAHRDIKGENFLLQTEGPIEGCIIKAVDFGTAKQFMTNMPMTTALGTPMFIAPEVLKRSYKEACDLWSCGCMMYIMLSGFPPFQGVDDSETLKLVSRAPLRFKTEEWQGVSKLAIDLVRNLLRREPRVRLTAVQALEHHWFRSHEGADPSSAVEIDHRSLQHRLRKFCEHGQFKKVALNIVARQLTESDIGELREVFTSMDTNYSGFVSKAELRAALSKCGNGNLEALLEGLDGDGNGLLDYSEFLAATMDKKHYQQEEVLKEAFRVFDREGTGAITAEDIERVMESGGVKRRRPSQVQVPEMLAELGKADTGHITYEEFKVLMQSSFSAFNADAILPDKVARYASEPWKPLTARLDVEEAFLPIAEEGEDDVCGHEEVRQATAPAPPAQVPWARQLSVKTGVWELSKDGVWSRSVTRQATINQGAIAAALGRSRTGQEAESSGEM